MKEQDKTNEQLINELEEMRRSITELEALTARYQQEVKELKPAEQRYQSIFELAPDGIMMIDARGIITSCNKAYFKLTGFSEEEIIGKHFSKLRLLRARDIPKYVKLFASILSGKEMEPIEFTWIHKDGISRTGEFRSAVIKAGRRIIGVQAVARDITGRKRAEEDIRKFRTITDGANYGIAMISSNEGKIIYTNEVFATMCGYTPDQLIGSHYSILFTEEQLKDADTVRNQLLSAGGSVTVELWRKRKDGTVFPTLTRTIVVNDDKGKPLYIAATVIDITEQKQVEEALKESEQRYMHAEELGQFGHWHRNIGEEEITWSPGTYRIFGVEPDRFQPTLQSVLNLVHPSDREALSKQRENAELHGKKFDIEIRIIRPDGKERIVHSTADIHRDEKGNPSRLFGTFIDITDRRRIQEELRESEERYRALVNLGAETGEAVVMLQDDERGVGMHVFASEAWSRITGYSTEELLNISMADLIHPRDREAAVERHNRRMRGEGLPGLYEITILKKGGTEVPVEVTYAFSRYRGKLVNVGYIRDITKRKHTEEALQTSESKYRNLHDTMAEGVTYRDTNGELISMNPAAERVLGLKAEQIKTAENIKDILKTIREDGSDYPVEEHPVFVSLRTGKPVNNQVMGIFNLQKGDFRWVNVNAVPQFRPGEDKPYQVFITFSDITERKALEEERQKSERLESVGTLAGGIAHDFNNLLTGITGYIGLGMRNVELGQAEKAYDMLTKAEDASLQARNLTQQLLTFARGGAPVKKVTSINQLIRDSATFALRGSNVSCDFSFLDDLWSVEVDEGQMNQVISNLVINADEAMPGGGVLSIKAENTALGARSALPLAKGKYVEIIVEDRGTGIRKEHLEKIFDPYFTTKHKGSGLGLATAYSIVNNHGGYITVQSKLGIGTTFHIYLPASKRPAPRKEEVTAEAPVTGGGRVLVMDDQDVIRQFLFEELTDIGYEVELSGDGTEAIEMYRRAKESGHPFDAVILDLTVPGGMGGKQTIEKLLEIDPEVKAIVSSGYSTAPIMSDFREYGFKGVVAKPYKIGELERTLGDVIQAERSDRL